jgi:2-methylfumaryl-CoA hydratase
MGNFFEDLTLGRRFRHGTARTVTDGDVSLYIALTGARQPLASSAPLARRLGYPARPLDELLTFNIAFGKTVPDVSLNAVANLGYADVRFRAPVFPGDTLHSESEVIGRREVSSGDAGVVYVSTRGFDQDGRCVLSYVRWVLVRKAEPARPSPNTHVPELPAQVAADDLAVPPLSAERDAMTEATGSLRFWGDYLPGERIDHSSGMTIDASDHTLATKLYQNTARAHFDSLAMRGRRLVYGGHVMSLCRALSYDGLENIICVAAINAGTHVAPTHAGDTLYAATEVLDCFDVPGRPDLGALRLRLVGLKDQPPEGVALYAWEAGKARRHPAVVLDLDYTVLLHR